MGVQLAGERLGASGCSCAPHRHILQSTVKASSPGIHPHVQAGRRDALLLGKFLAGLGRLALALTAIWLPITGLGLVRLGVPPGSEEVARSLWFLLIMLCYGRVWLALALVCSIVFHQPATATLASIAVWLFFTVFWGMIAGILAQTLRPVQAGLP